MTFMIEMLPAREGDCLLLSYGEGCDVRRVLIDAGRAATWPTLKQRLDALPAAERELELLVITHVDRDHVEGVLKMLEDASCPVTFKDIWFNGYGHLKAVDDEDFGAVQGERLTELLLSGLPWNRAFARRSVRMPKEGVPAALELDGGLKLTLLSPTADKLVRLRPDWEKECKEAQLIPSEELPPPLPGEEQFGPIDVERLAAVAFAEDRAPANGSSIALLAEFAGRRLLLGADAHPSILVDGLNRLFPEEPRVRLEAFKLAHHGSRANLSLDLLDRIECSKYLVSTNGSYFKHPDREAIARVLRNGGAAKTIFFNYKSTFNEVWDEAGLRQEYGYDVIYGADGSLEVPLD